MVLLVSLPLKFELYPQRTNKKVSQGDSYNPGMKRRKQSICRPAYLCFLLAVVYLKDKIVSVTFYCSSIMLCHVHIYQHIHVHPSIYATPISLSLSLSYCLFLSLSRVILIFIFLFHCH